MSYSHLTTFERARIETLRANGLSIRAISNVLNRSPSTISRELKRNGKMDKYEAENAQAQYKQRRLKCAPAGKQCQEWIEIIEEKLVQTWSPEQIANTVLKGKLSFKTIYRWLYQGILMLTDHRVLRHKGKRQKPRETRGRFNVGTSISKRPQDVKKRESFGHWELDSVVSGRGKSKGCLATFIERKTRHYMAICMPDRTSDSMESAIRTLFNQLPEGAFLTATVDRGKEFSCFTKVEADLEIAVYFADPYSSWQRGSNENANGLLREFFPKATDLACLRQHEVDYVVGLMNHRPRRCLNWKTAHEAFHEEVLRLS